MKLLFASQDINLLFGLCICLPFILIAVIIIYSRYRYKVLSRRNLKNKHIIITGGSSGIGKSLGHEAAKRGANVTLIARNEQRLVAAKTEVNASCVCSTQRIHTLSLDITNDFEEIEKAFIDLEQEMGPPYMIMNCAGNAVCGKLEDTSTEDIKKMFQLNCLGSIYATKAVVEKMKSQGFGHIVFVASEAAFVGIFGLSVYSASKFALRGFAEALNMEVRNHGVQVTVAYPPDTDTPGFAEEEKSKPQETRLISQTSGLWKPDEVAKRILNDSLAGYFTSTNGMDGFLLSTLCAGMSPSTNVAYLLLQAS
uniref:3-dehydrosphinganine reductase n=1 Tax=Rhodnius prolixus TaxID=13249 RepID=T1HQ05_RHOPR